MIADSRATLVTKLETLTPVRVRRGFPDAGEISVPPANLWVFGPIKRTLDTQDGGVSRDWEIYCIVASTESARLRSQDALDPFLDETGPQSVIQAVDDGQWIVTGWSDYGQNEVGVETGMWGVRFEVSELA